MGYTLAAVGAVEFYSNNNALTVSDLDLVRQNLAETDLVNSDSVCASIHQS